MRIRQATFLGLSSLMACLLAFFGASVAYAGAPSEIHIKPDGKFYATNVSVTQKAGKGNLFSRITWGDAYVRVTVLAHDDTVITKAHGEIAGVNDIQEKDILDVEGKLYSGDGVLIINATRIRDNSLQVESKNISGTVISVNQEQTSLVLANKIFGATTTVLLSPSATIRKGARIIGFNDLLPGDKILSAPGAYDYTSNTFTASSIEVFQEKNIFKERNFQGTLKSISGTTLPAVLSVAVGDANYTVYLGAGAEVLNSRKKPAGLTRFIIGDTVRLYGAIRATNLGEIDANILRDLNF